MSQANLPQLEKRLISELAALAAARANAETTLRDEFQATERHVRRTHQEKLAEIEQQDETTRTTRAHEESLARAGLAEQFKNDQETLAQQYRDSRERITAEIETAEAKAEVALREARWLARTVYESGRKRLHQQAAELHKQLRGRRSVARAIEHHANACLSHFGQARFIQPSPSAPLEKVVAEDAREKLSQSIAAANGYLRELQSLRLPGFLQGGGLVLIFLALIAILLPSAGWLVQWHLLFWLVPSAVAIASIGAAIGLWLTGKARHQTMERYEPLMESLREANVAYRRCMAWAAARFKERKTELRAHRKEQGQRALKAYQPQRALCRTRREQELPQLIVDTESQLAALEKRRDEALRQLDERCRTQELALTAEHQRALAENDAALARGLAANQARLDQGRRQSIDHWQQGIRTAHEEAAAISQRVSAASPAWAQHLSSDWQWPNSPPDAIRFGELAIQARNLVSGKIVEQLGDEAMQLALALPAVLRFPEEISLFVRAQDTGRAKAIELLQVVMLRLLLTVPASKLRFTIIDPVGLGQNFAAFMHLADYEEALVTHRIWTEPNQIEQRLADLTEHMETVIQKYLRDEYPTIGAYNLEAGEIAEPYRVLVVANYPAGFSEAAARRLLTIAANGPRCGVHVLLSTDTKLPPVPGISISELQKHATLFSANGGGLTWQDREFKTFPLAIDVPPPADQFKAILQAVGKQAVRAKRVEVPFEAIAPAAEDYWAADSRSGIDIPLGRVGATRLQHLRLGQGTAQHVLIAGKTGSGKSTLLHALVTNAALRYGPDQLELYLIDFKKGVEFKTYVTHELPHARVVAIESEREFGLSVMQRLDAEMQARGELFRESGVQDIAGYRNLHRLLPRILLVVDEFQEFFTEDDKLSQEAALLLDRLIRQGRAFGIHIHLGSQTLAGAYTLARSTLGQVGVRIALQCSEADAHLILSEDNQAARLLSRPGEAIYNDANGLVEGNHPFQVVWLPDERRETYLEAIQRLLAERPRHFAHDQIVFEGTKPADIEKNVKIAEVLAAGAPGDSREPRVWIGEPLAIQESTSVAFPRRTASNLLWLGQNEEAVAGMIGAAILALCAQVPPIAGLPSCTIVTAGAAGPLSRLASLAPDRVRIVGPRDLATLLNTLSGELQRRQTLDDAGPPHFLFVYDLARLRELRRQDDGFGFSRSFEPAPPKPDRQFMDLLREGPPLGLHALVWCDTLTNFNRVLDRQALKEFDHRVLLQMSAADSSLLVDAPVASQLGRYRALVHQEDQGRLEKFRPFSLPSETWLQEATGRLARSGIALEKTEIAPDPSRCTA